MTMELSPNGTRGAEMPKIARRMMKASQGIMTWFAQFAGERMVVLTTVGAKTGRTHSVVVSRFPEGESASLVVASNGGSARHPAWYINMARNPDQVWAKIGNRKFKVRPVLLKGAERQEAWQRVIRTSPAYAGYEQRTDREIPIVRLVPEE